MEIIQQIRAAKERALASGDARPSGSEVRADLDSDVGVTFVAAAEQIAADKELRHIFNRLEELGCYKSPLSVIESMWIHVDRHLPGPTKWIWQLAAKPKGEF